MMENYLQVLEDSLHKKMDVLCRIEALCAKQGKILSMEPVSEDDFDKSIDEKGALIDELNLLDVGFENLYDRIKEQLMAEKDGYKLQIAALQNQIAEITEKSMAIQAQETRNKKLAEAYFIKAKRELKERRRNSKAALDYYRNMNKSQVVSPQFMDKKK